MQDFNPRKTNSTGGGQLSRQLDTRKCGSPVLSNFDSPRPILFMPWNFCVSLLCRLAHSDSDDNEQLLASGWGTLEHVPNNGPSYAEP